MNREMIKGGQWILAEGAPYGYYMFKLFKGKVSIYRGGVKVNEITVKEGDKPVFLGTIAVLRDDGAHSASVKSDTDIEVERIYVDQMRGIIRNEVPEEIKKDISIMIQAIVIQNEITRLKQTLESLPKVDLKIPADERIREILEEINGLYKNIMPEF